MGLCQKILIFTSLLHHLSSEKVTLFNVFKRKGLTEDWTRYNDKCVGTTSWYYNTNDRANPKYVVCLTRGCFLESASYSIKSVNTVYADVKFTGRFCSGLINPNPECAENMTLNAIIQDTFPNDKSPNAPTQQEMRFPISDDIKIPKSVAGYFDVKQTIQFDNKFDKTYIRYLFDSKMACGYSGSSGHTFPMS